MLFCLGLLDGGGRNSNRREVGVYPCQVGGGEGQILEHWF